MNKGKVSDGGRAPFIFEFLELHNYKMHMSTKVMLNEKPIIVISGANGSGKTQILEALILSLGYTPNRVAVGKLSDVIGPFGTESIIVLKVNNPRLTTQRLFVPTDPDLAKIEDCESFKIMTVIRPDSTIKRTIILENNEKIHITRKQLQKLFSSIGIVEGAKLNFTEEGTLSAFDEGSPHKKLMTLLEATGVTSLYENYLSAKLRLEEYKRETSPLQLRLEEEKLRLAKLRDIYDKILKKSELLERRSLVEREYYWRRVLEFESRLKHNKNELMDITKRYDDTLTSLEKQRNELKTLHQRIMDLEQNEKRLQDKVAALRDTIVQIKAEIKWKESAIKEYENEKHNLLQQRKKLLSLHSTEGLSKKQQLLEQLSSLKAQIKELEDREKIYEARQNALLNERERLLQSKRKRIKLIGELSDAERNLVITSSQFKNEIKEKGYSSEIIGPLYEIISIKPEFLTYENAIKAALGRNLFAFIATSLESYKKAKEIYDRIFTSSKPNFVVGRVLDTAGPVPQHLITKSLISPDRALIDYVTNLIEAPFHARLYLNRVINIILAKPFGDPNHLTDLAKKHKAVILTADLNGYYLPYEAFGRPPKPYQIKLGVELSSYYSLSKLDAEIREIEEKIEENRREHFNIKHQIGMKKLEKNKISQELQLWDLTDDEYSKEFSKLELELSKIDEKLKRATEDRDSLLDDISKLRNESKLLMEELENIRINLFRLNKEKREVERQIEKLERTKNNLANIKQQLSLTIIELEKNYDEAKAQAAQTGEKPDVIRDNLHEIEAELYRIEGQLEQLDIQPNITEEDIRNHEERVEYLERQIELHEEHKKNLQADVNARLERWESSLKEKISELNKILNLLLKDIFEEIKISVYNYKDERKGELIISALTKGDFRNYRQLSGGEKTLVAQALILSLHMITQAPIHAIDEFTQKLDKKNKAVAFSMALTAYKMAQTGRFIQPQFILICPNLDDVELSDDFSHQVLVETKVDLND